MQMNAQLDAQMAAQVEEMARCFAEEFVRMGWSEEAVISLFADPFYRAPHSVYRARGEAYVTALVTEVAAAHRQRRQARRGTPPAG